MKRVMSLIVVIALCFAGTIALYAQESQTTPTPEKEHPMASFMGWKWGIDARYVAYSFDNKKYEKILLKKGFKIENYPLGAFDLKEIGFIFEDKYGQERDFVNTNYPSLLLDAVVIKFTPNKFEDMYDILKIKYGDPTADVESNIQSMTGVTLLQKIPIWLDLEIGRQIVLTKYSDNIMEGAITFCKYDPNFFKSREEKLKAAAALLRP